MPAGSRSPRCAIRAMVAYSPVPPPWTVLKDEASIQSVSQAQGRYTMNNLPPGITRCRVRVLLAEDHIAVASVERAPSGDAPLQGPAHTGVKLGVPAANLLEDRHRADVGCRLQDRHDLAVPHAASGSGRRRPRGVSSATATADRLQSDR